MFCLVTLHLRDGFTYFSSHSFCIWSIDWLVADFVLRHWFCIRLIDRSITFKLFILHLSDWLIDFPQSFCIWLIDWLVDQFFTDFWRSCIFSRRCEPAEAASAAAHGGSARGPAGRFVGKDKVHFRRGQAARSQTRRGRRGARQGGRGETRRSECRGQVKTTTLLLFFKTIPFHTLIGTHFGDSVIRRLRCCCFLLLLFFFVIATNSGDGASSIHALDKKEWY